MSLMGGLYVGTSGLQTSQNALNTTAHNLANINTAGYTRQQVTQGDRMYDTIGSAYVSAKQVGLGVNYSDVRTVRDYFLDKQYRQEASRSAYYSTSLDAVNEINTLFGETEGTEFQAALKELENAFMDLARNPSDSTYQGVLINRTAQFLERAKAVYNGICDYQDNLNEQIKDQVDKINDYAKQIKEINYKITVIESGKVEAANDLRDTRDRLLDELSAMGRIAWQEDQKGVVKVQFEGVDLVNGDFVNPLEAKVKDEDLDTGFYSVVWSRMDDQDVYSTKFDVSAAAGTDSGSLKALVFSRGDHRATFKDITGGGKYTDETDGQLYPNTAEHAYSEIDYSSCMTIMAEFDNLIHNITAGIDRTLAEAMKDPVTGAVDSRLKLIFTQIDQANKPGNDPVADDFYDNYTCSNLSINSDLLRVPTDLNSGFVKDDYSVDQNTADALSELFSNPDKVKDLFGKDGDTNENKIMITLNATQLTPLRYSDYYIGIVDQYATLGSTYKSLASAQEVEVNKLEEQRQQVVGVSDNEELTKMVKFQNAYNASSRYFNTVNQMLEHLLTSLA